MSKRKRIIKQAAVTALSVPVMMVPYYSLVAGERCDSPEHCLPTQSHEHDFEFEQASTSANSGGPYQFVAGGSLNLGHMELTSHARTIIAPIDLQMK